jgi:hypothetical protein
MHCQCSGFLDAAKARERRGIYPCRNKQPRGRCESGHVGSVAAAQRRGLENYQDIRQGDVIECLRTETVARTL